MVLKKFVIHHFRNIERAHLQPADKINMIVGQNGSGKTSLLEAIHFLSVGRSFRTSHTNRVIGEQAKYLTLFAETQVSESIQRLGLTKTRSGETEIKIADAKVKRLADLARALPTQIIHPDGFVLVTGSPRYRRHFLDWGLFQSQPEFFATWHQCKHLLQQRNALLRQRCTLKQIAYWDELWVKHALDLTHMRQAYLTSFNHQAKKILQDFLPMYNFELQLIQGWPEQMPLQTCLQQQFWQSDKQRGFTQIGPHKADLKIKADQVPVQDRLSRGQLKLLVCALKLAQSQHLYQTTQRCSILLIDDLTAELDRDRRDTLMQQLLTAPFQVFLTAIHEDQLTQWCSTMTTKMFHVKQGQIIPSHNTR